MWFVLNSLQILQRKITRDATSDLLKLQKKKLKKGAGGETFLAVRRQLLTPLDNLTIGTVD